MYTVPTMHAIFVVHCWVTMKPLNSTHITNLQQCANQLTNHNSWFGVRGPPKNTFAPSPHTCTSVPGLIRTQQDFLSKIIYFICMCIYK